jgi:VanZ family protein
LVRYWLPPLALMGLIFALSARPDLPDVGGSESVWDLLVKKGGHFLGYGLLAWLFYRALSQYFTPSMTLRLVSAALAIVYGLTDEVHQTFVPDREGRLRDVAVDGVGALAVMLLTGWLEGRRAPAHPVRAGDAE